MTDKTCSSNVQIETELLGAQKKQPLFSFVKITKYYLIPFMVPLFWEITDIFQRLYLNSNEILLKKPSTPLLVLLSLVYLFGGLTHFITRKNNILKDQNKNENDKNKNRPNNPRESIVIDLFEQNQKQRLIKCIKITAIITLIGSIGESSVMSTKLISIFDIRLFYLIFTSLFYVIFSKKKLFNHQIISLVTSGLGMIIVILVKILYQKGGEINWLEVLFIVIRGIIHSVELVVGKYIMESILIPPLLYLFISGIFKFTYEFSIDFFYSFREEESLFVSFKYLVDDENKISSIIFLILFFFSSMIFQILVYLTNYYFSPILLAITDLLSPLLQLIFEEITGIGIGGRLGLYEFVFTITGYMICLVAMVFYNELIICNFCGLNENTVQNISKRGVNEQKTILRNVSDENNIDNIDCDLESDN